MNTSRQGARVRLAAAYLDRQDGASWEQIAAAYGYKSAASALASLYQFARNTGLPWPIVTPDGNAR